MKILSYILAVVLGALAAFVLVQRAAPAGGSVMQEKVIRDIRPAATVDTEILARQASRLDELARENLALKTKLAAALARLADREVALTQTTARLDELRRPMMADILSSSLRAELKSGEVVVTGGYLLPDGRRLYAFARPVIEDAGAGNVVKIGVQLLKIDDAQAGTVGLDTLATNAANTLQHGEVWVADEYDEVLGKVKAEPGFAGLSVSPDLSVQPGDSAGFEIDDLKLRFTPEIAADGVTMDFEVRLEQPQLPAVMARQPDPQPPR